MTAELNADDILRPRRLAKQDVVNRMNQCWNNMPFISRIYDPINTNIMVWIAESKKSIDIFESR